MVTITADAELYPFVEQGLNLIWNTATNPNNPDLKRMGKFKVLFKGEAQIQGYLAACYQFRIIEEDAYNLLSEFYKNRHEYEGMTEEANRIVAQTTLKNEEKV